jgi:hypothetical protein
MGGRLTDGTGSGRPLRLGLAVGSSEEMRPPIGSAVPESAGWPALASATVVPPSVSAVAVPRATMPARQAARLWARRPAGR